MRQEQGGFINHIGKRPAINQFDESLIHYKGDRFAAALKCINHYIKNNRHDVQAYYMKAHLLECMGKWQESIACIDQVWDPEDATPDMMLLRALQYMHVCDTEKSLGFIDDAQRAGAFAGDVYRYRAIVMYNLTAKGCADLFEESVECILEACSTDPQNKLNHGEAANMLYTKFERCDRADKDLLILSIKHGKKAIELGDKQHRTFYNLGRAWFHMNNYDMAIVYFEQTAKIDKNFANAHAMIGISMMQNEKSKYPSYRNLATKHLDKALKKDPKLAIALQAKAKIHLGDWNFDGAQKILKVLTAAEPYNVQAWVCLAATYADQYGKDPVNCWPKMERASQCLERVAGNAKHDIPSASDLELIGGDGDRNRRMSSFGNYTTLDSRHDDTTM